VIKKYKKAKIRNIWPKHTKYQKKSILDLSSREVNALIFTDNVAECYVHSLGVGF